MKTERKNAVFEREGGLVVFIIKTALLKRLFEDKLVEKRVNEARTWREVGAIIAEEVRRRGLKVVEA